MKTLILTLILLLLIASPAYADVCFDDEIAGKMVVELEQCRIQKDSIDIYKQTIANLEEQVRMQDEMLTVYRDSLTKAKENIEGYQKLLDEQKGLYEAEIKKAKPSFIERIVTGVGFMGLGAVIAGLLILL